MTLSVAPSPAVTRRGVLLLVVLSLLTLFMLLGTTFLILSARARTTARAYLRLAEDQTRTADGYGPFLREAAMQVIRGTERPSSALKFHDLLGDRYGISGGREFFIGSGSNPPGIAPALVAGSQVLKFQLLVNLGDETVKNLALATAANRTGQVLTFLDPPLAGISLPIIASCDKDGLDSNVVYVLKPSQLVDIGAIRGTRIWINDRAFAGSGLLAAEVNTNWGLVGGRPVGSANEGYDAPDGQNLAIQTPSFGPLRAPGMLPADDLDADGDGQIDSVWMDLGIAPFSMPDRTLVKPLFAIRCIDLGGRVNLNVHGSPAHLAATPPEDTEIAESGSAAPTLRPGLGFTPLDVRLDTVIGQDGLARVMQGSPATSQTQTGPIVRRVPAMVGRYGGPLGPTAAADPSPWPLPRLRGLDFVPGLYGGGPADFWSLASVAVDRWGQPRFLPQQGMASADAAAPPSALDLTGTRICTPIAGELQGAAASLDQPYSPSEMEALLRPFDVDNAAILPQRLLAMALDVGRFDNFRTNCTTESWDTPAVIGGAPSFIGGDKVSRASFDPDLVGGLRMDLNRPFGDGQDNDSDLLVDEPTEVNWAAAEDRQRLLRSGRPSGMPLQPGEKTSANSIAPGLLARQVFAWHLYNVLVALEGANGLPVVPLALAAGSWAGTTFQLQDPRVKSIGIGNHNRQVLAQWAVNVVDFMDPDSIMTPFRFKTGSGASNVVWGCEAPDLIITETLALHDRGIADTAMDAETQKKVGNQDGDDANWDQVRRPRGSLFVELYRVRGVPAGGRLPAELYDQDNRLNLGKMPTASTEPVWRLAIQDVNDPGDEVFSTLQKNPDTEWLSPGSGGGEIGGGRAAQRFVWFTNQAPQNGTAGGARPTNTYVMPQPPRDGGSPLLAPGQHLVIGPRKETPLGDAQTGNAPSPQKIVLDPTGGVRVTNLNGDQTASAAPQVCLVELAQISNGVNGPSGLNVSEPLGDNYYAGDDGFYDPPLGDPFPESIPPSLLAQGTHPNVSTVFLQRLADPTRPHEPDSSKPEWNPYVTVDFMPIDLHVFNGSSAAEQEALDGQQVTKPHPDRPWHFHTRQRGLGTTPGGSPLGSGLLPNENFSNAETIAGERPALTANPWMPAWPAEADNPPGPTQNAPIAGDVAHFAYLLNQPGENPVDSWPMHTLGSWNISFGGIANGKPTTPFPWIVWNDRPFASPYELLLVPRTSPGRLLTNYRNPSQDPLGNRQPPPGRPMFDAYGVWPRAGHLLPFTGINDPEVGKTNPNADILSRLFGFVRVISPFAGTHVVLTDAPNETDPVARRWRAPFNAVPTYREPGGINLNTVSPGSSGAPIWNAILGLEDSEVPTAAPSWDDVVELRDENNPLLQAPSSKAGRAGTLLLRKPDKPGMPGGPLFGPPGDAALPSGSDQYRYEERNAWFAYEPLIRAAAHTTPRSEVYAIWITMGFFEVSPTLREYGSQTGDIRRHRAFYLYDRSIPVGYQPGSDHNVANGILVERLVD